MHSTAFEDIFNQSTCILGEGALIERLRRNSHFELDPFIVNSGFIYEESKRDFIASIYRQYLDIGQQYDLPLLLSTPTWRASRQRIADAGYAGRDVNGDNFRFLDNLRKSYGAYASKVVICGLLSCKGDAYDRTQALEMDEAHSFHSWQAARLAEAGVDFLMASTLPVLGEAIGLARAMAETGKPCIVSFVARPEGTMLDGTPLKKVVSVIDSQVNPRPFAYMVNCTHASIFRSALLHDVNASSVVRERIVGLLANTAALTPEELDNAETLIEEAPEVFGRDLAALHNDLGIKILGGCCGTDERHIGDLAARLAGICFRK
ncbi:MAG: homocysteine S-methyltransferase family protein [Deltaproteobacteria bacterium]|nr:homocysteine S-methyltransferase family protein [Deltaproteobacteria bacterium]